MNSNSRNDSSVWTKAKKQNNDFWDTHQIASLTNRESSVEKVTQDFKENTNILNIIDNFLCQHSMETFYKVSLASMTY